MSDFQKAVKVVYGFDPFEEKGVCVHGEGLDAACGECEAGAATRREVEDTSRLRAAVLYCVQGKHVHICTVCNRGFECSDPAMIAEGERYDAVCILCAMAWKVGGVVRYNDGREGHNVRGVILEVDERGMVVQFEDRASTSRISFSDEAWMAHITRVGAAEEWSSFEASL